MSTHRNGNNDEITRYSLNPCQIAVTRVEWRTNGQYQGVCVSLFLFQDTLSRDFIDSVAAGGAVAAAVIENRIERN